jgi:transcriptional regulator with XRE-family HTH domain
VIGPAGERVADNLWQLRTARGISIRQLSVKLRTLGHPLSTEAISKIENGRASVPMPKQVRRVDVDDLLALAAALAVQPARLWAESTKCATCFGAPPPGFICVTCSARAPYPTA